MRTVLVQDIATKAYFCDFDEWRNSSIEARNFGTSLSAIAFCLQNGLESAQVVIKFEDAASEDIIVPLNAPLANRYANA